MITRINYYWVAKPSETFTETDPDKIEAIKLLHESGIVQVISMSGKFTRRLH